MLLPWVLVVYDLRPKLVSLTEDCLARSSQGRELNWVVAGLLLALVVPGLNRESLCIAGLVVARARRALNLNTLFLALSVDLANNDSLWWLLDVLNRRELNFSDATLTLTLVDLIWPYE